MARKLDLSGVKNFFLAKGEKLGVAACVAAACVLVGYGVMNGMGAKHAPNSTHTFPEAYKGGIDKVNQQIRGGETVPGFQLAKIDVWDTRQPNFNQGRLFDLSDNISNKRNNPKALAVKADPEKNQIRMDYVRAPIFVYDVNVLNPMQKSFTAVKGRERNVGVGAPGLGAPGVAGQGRGGMQPVVAVKPMRGVVVQAVFPLTEQIEEFRKAFRMLHTAELFQSRELPRFLGLNVMKAEVVSGQPLTWTPLVVHNANAEKEWDDVDPALQALMREAIFDDQFIKLRAPFVFQGLVMPLPKLATLPLGQTYPKADLEGLMDVWDLVQGGGVGVPMGGVDPGMMRAPGEGGMIPGMPAPGAATGRGEAELEAVVWSKLAPDIRDKFADDFFLFDPLGMFPDPNEGKAAAADKNAVQTAPRDGEDAAGAFHAPSMFAASAQWLKFPAPKMPKHLIPDVKGEPGLQPKVHNNAAMLNVKPYEALVRFIDVDVKPGKTYKYSIQVRIANPNFGKQGEVTIAAHADMKELPPAPPVETPTITIPTEYFLYAIDQKPHNPKVVNGSEDKDVRQTTNMQPNQTHVPIQIHTWVERTVDSETGNQYVIADWAIAERLLLRRGDPIGRTTTIEIPVWDKARGAYDLSQPIPVNLGAAPKLPGQMKKFGKDGEMMLPPPELGKGPARPKKKDTPLEAENVGVPIDFSETSSKAVLIDFDGGKRAYPIPGASGTAPKDDSAVSMLIMTGDGKLIVRNSRVDSDPDSAEYKVRQQRIEDWKSKIAPFRGGGAGVVPGGGVPDLGNPFLNKKGGAN